MKIFLKSVLFVIFSVMVANATQTVNVSFINLPNNNVNDVYVGYLDAQVSGIGMQDILCDDRNHTTYVPSGPYEYYISTLSNLDHVRFSQPQELINYEIAAILLYQYDNAGGDHASSFDTASYQYALWNVFTPSTFQFGNSVTLLEQARALQILGSDIALNAYNELEILTPTEHSLSNQEFIFLHNFSEVPEPTFFFGVGLICVGFCLKKVR